MGARGVLRTVQGGGLLFFCPGCKENHQVWTGEGAGPRWGFNGDYDRPTFTPSVLIQRGHHNPRAVGHPCWCDFEERTGRKPIKSCGVCHSFVTDGQIQFLGD